MATATFDYVKEAARVRDALRRAFPDAAFSTSEGWQGRVHVKIVSELFDRKSESDKRQIVEDALQDTLGEQPEAVSLILVYGMDEI